MVRHRLGVTVAIAIVAIARSSEAEPTARPARMHSGFTLRASLGVAVLRDLVAIESATGAAGDEEDTGVVTGYGSSVELAFGWVVDSGLAVGLYILEDDGHSGSADFDTQGVMVSAT